MKKLLFGLLALVAISCSEDEVADVRDQALGTYTYTSKGYYLNGSTLVYIADTDGGSFTVEKSTTNSDNVLIKEGGDTIIGEKIEEASNGFGFDVDDFTDDGSVFTGYDGFELSGTKYHGGYIASTKKFTFYYKYTEDGVVYVIEITGTKR